MSPLLRDELRVMLCPGEVLVTRVGRAITPRGLRRHVVARMRLPCGQDRDGSGRDLPWSAALGRLDAFLPEQGGRVFATVILSNHLTRYAVVPWSEALNDPVEEEAYARHCFRQQYGSAADRWDICLDTPRPGIAQLASALDRRLLDALRALFESAGIPLSSVQPHLMAVFNHCRGMLQERSAWFVLHEPGVLCLALLRDGCWASVRTVRTGDDWFDALPMLLTREAYLTETEVDAETVCMWAPGLGMRQPPACGARPVRNLAAALPEGFIADYSPDYPVAVTS